MREYCDYLGEEEKPSPSVLDISDRELVLRAVKNASRMHPRNKCPLWFYVSEAFALGSTYSAQLCHRFDLDPDIIITHREPLSEDDDLRDALNATVERLLVTATNYLNKNEFVLAAAYHEIAEDLDSLD
jgi:hypothetical protein